MSALLTLTFLTASSLFLWVLSLLYVYQFRFRCEYIYARNSVLSLTSHRLKGFELFVRYKKGIPV